VKNLFYKRKKQCPLSQDPAEQVDYKNIKLISRFISERGRILPSRITSVSAMKQRELREAIKRARILALLPFSKK
jgi:small subunit ribosomal protein S18